MTQEEKQLLLKDLCARVPYGVKVHVGDDWAMTLRQIDYKCFCECWENEDIKSNSRWMLPYLRPMSSMTEEEKRELAEEQKKDEELFLYIIHKSQEGDDSLLGTAIPHYAEDWANKNHFDYRGLIQMGLALEAPEGMYK